MMLTPQQRGNAEMGLDVYCSTEIGLQAASIITPLWPNGEIVYDIDRSIGEFLRFLLFELNRWHCLNTTFTFTEGSLSP